MRLKRWIRIFAATAALLSSAGCNLAVSVGVSNTPESPERKPRFTLLQVNDSYKIEGLENGSLGGFARLRSLRKQLEAQDGGEVLLLHAGDFLFPSVMSKYLKADAMIRVLNLMDGDAAAFDGKMLVAFGNHEFDDPDPGVVLGRIAQSDFAWVSSNTRYRSSATAPGEPFSSRLHNVHDVVVKEIDGVKVGVFGITLDVQNPPYVAYDYEPQARRAAIRSALATLKQADARVIIALTHQDFDQDQALAREFPEIDLIVGGHEHFFIEKKIGHTWITKADADNKSAIVHHIQVNPDGTVETSHDKIGLDSTVVKDPLVQAEVDAQLARLEKALQKNGKDLRQVLGQTRHALEGVEPAVRGRETALGNFLADVIRERLKSDVAFINGGSIRINDNIPPGPVTVYDMEGIFYYDNRLVGFELTGSQLLDILRNSVSKSHLGDGRFLQVSGIRFKYHVKDQAGQPVYAIEAADVEILPQGAKQFTPLRLDKTYRAASTDFIWEKGYVDGYGIFSKGQGKTSPPLTGPEPAPGFRNAVEEAIAGLPGKTITSQVEGRIVRLAD